MTFDKAQKKLDKLVKKFVDQIDPTILKSDEYQAEDAAVDLADGFFWGGYDWSSAAIKLGISKTELRSLIAERLLEASRD